MVVHIGKLLIVYQMTISIGVICLHVLLLLSYMRMERFPALEIEKPTRAWTNNDHTIWFCLTNETKYDSSSCPGMSSNNFKKNFLGVLNFSNRRVSKLVNFEKENPLSLNAHLYRIDAL